MYNIKKRKIKISLYLILIILIIIAVGAVFVFAGGFLGKSIPKSSFSADVFFLKIGIQENGSSTNNIKIVNLDNFKKDFSAKINNLEGYVSLDKSSFQISENGKYDLKLEFDGRNKIPGAYLGYLAIKTGAETKKIPIIFEIHSKNTLFDSNINLYPQGKDIAPGQRISFEIKVFDLAYVGKSNLVLDYSIKSFDGKILLSESENVVVDGRLDYSKSVDLPLETPIGDYALIVILKHKDSTGVSSTSFRVVEEPVELLSLNNSWFWVIVIFVLFFFLFLFLMIYSWFYRDKALRELQSMYQKELRKEKELIKIRGKENLKKLKSPAEKKLYRKVAGKISRKRIQLLKGMHKRKIKEYRKIKKKTHGREYDKQIRSWKNQGYDISILDKKYRIPSADDIRKKIREWKKKGYETSVLER